ncbi:MAG: hypothetical protein J6W40_03400 [Alphaproteobacteria bacterium]|nr:hypothetical protein [Alphaproteobacteria bacterium]
MAKYKAIITQRDGTRIFLDLNCREYHAQNTYEDKRNFTATCKNCGAFHYFYFEKITRKTKKRQVKFFKEVD